MEANVIWQQGISFNAMNEPGTVLKLGREHDSFSPMGLLTIALAGCTAMDVISILEKMRQNITRFEVKVHADRASEHPKVFTHAIIEYLVTGHTVDPDAVTRSINLSATRYCSVQAMCQKAFPIELRYSIFEDLGERQSRLVADGIHIPQPEVKNEP